MGEFAKGRIKIGGQERRSADHGAQTASGELLPGGVKDIETLIKEGLDPFHAAYVFVQKNTLPHA